MSNPKTLIKIFEDLTPEQEQKIVKFLDEFVTTEFIVERQY